MAKKDLAAQIEEKEKELAALKAEVAGESFPEYPKWITDPKDPSKGYTVNSAEEEKARKGGSGSGASTFDKTVEELEAEKVAKFEADKDAAKGHSRLAGPEKASEKGKR